MVDLALSQAHNNSERQESQTQKSVIIMICDSRYSPFLPEPLLLSASKYFPHIGWVCSLETARLSTSLVSVRHAYIIQTQTVIPLQFKSIKNNSILINKHN